MRCGKVDSRQLWICLMKKQEMKRKVARVRQKIIEVFFFVSYDG